MVAAVADEPTHDKTLIRCRCGQVLAEQWAHGAYNITGTTRFRVDSRRRIELVCPSCGKRTRLYPVAETVT